MYSYTPVETQQIAVHCYLPFTLPQQDPQVKEYTYPLLRDDFAMVELYQVSCTACCGRAYTCLQHKPARLCCTTYQPSYQLGKICCCADGIDAKAGMAITYTLQEKYTCKHVCICKGCLVWTMSCS
jgi:hypothetical protein